MKPKTGLHKKVAFIFEGVPTPPAPSSATAVSPLAPSSATAVSPAAPAGAADPNPSPQRLPTPSPVSGPSTTAAPRTSPKATRSPSTVRNRKKNKKDAKQTQMMILIGVLSIVLIAVLFLVLRTPASPPRKAAAASASAMDGPTVAQTTLWAKPQPWPEQIRDPMAPEILGHGPDSAAPDCVVRGIVFSQTRPSAIVGNQIVFIGDTYNGISIVNITRDAVEFEKDGKRWTQPVQP